MTKEKKAAMPQNASAMLNQGEKLEKGEHKGRGSSTDRNDEEGDDDNNHTTSVVGGGPESETREGWA